MGEVEIGAFEGRGFPAKFQQVRPHAHQHAGSTRRLIEPAQQFLPLGFRFGEKPGEVFAAARSRISRICSSNRIGIDVVLFGKQGEETAFLGFRHAFIARQYRCGDARARGFTAFRQQRRA